MRLSRSSILLTAAALSALWAMRDTIHREEAPSTTQDASRRGEMGKAETAAWLQNEIQASADPLWSSPRKEDLAIACAKLSASDRMALLEEIEQWYKSPAFGQSNQLRLRLLRLQPLRNQLLEQAAREDLETFLRRFPSGAKVLLKAAANKNGSETLNIWTEIRNEWQGFNRYSAPLDSEWIEEIGEVPTIRDEDEETSASAALAEGWAASDPETAWTALTSGQMEDATRPIILRGFFRGLSEATEWSTWTDRLQGLPWDDPGGSKTSPRGAAAVALARRWLNRDPDPALAWFLEDKASWDEEAWVAFRSDMSFNSGSRGQVTFVSEHTFLLADWMKADPEAASSWLSQASETLAPKEVLQEAASEMEIPESLQAQITARYGN